MMAVRSKKNILMICPFATPNVGGVETHIDKLIKVAVGKGFYVTLITYQPLTREVKASKFERGKGFEVHRVNWFGTGWFTKLEKYYPLVFIYLFPGIFFKSLLYYLRNHRNVHCVHAHGLAAAAVARVLGLIHKKNMVLSTHAVYGFGRRLSLAFFVRWVFKGFNTILCVSELSKDEIEKMWLPGSAVRVHKNWIDTNVFAPQKVDFKGVNVLFVGRLFEAKGIKLILDAAAKLPKITFHIVGSGELGGTVKEASEKFENIIFHGTLMQTDKEEFHKLLELYSGCDYILSPYLYDEGFSATLIESLACGTPVIISNRGSPPTFLEGSVAVFLSSYPLTKELVKVLGNLEKSSAKVREICRSYAVKNFSPRNANVIIRSYE